MTSYCGQIGEVAGTTGGGYVAMGTEDRHGNYKVPVGGLIRVATEIPVLQIGDTRLKNVRLCMGEVAPYLRQGDTACVFAFGHLLRKKIIIGVKSQSGPSWTMSLPRFFATFITYLTLWPFLVGLAGALVGALVGLLFGNAMSTAGMVIGALYGVGISLLSAVRLAITYRQMRAPAIASEVPRPAGFNDVLYHQEKT
jgi:hypothetical protein